MSGKKSSPVIPKGYADPYEALAECYAVLVEHHGVRKAREVLGRLHWESCYTRHPRFNKDAPIGNYLKNGRCM